MKNIPIIALIFTLFSCQSEKQNIVRHFEEQNKSLVYEVETIDELSFPDWLKGGWANTAESNTKNIITFSFNANKLSMRQGLYFQDAEKCIEPYKDYQISEIATDSTYLIELIKKNHSVEYEFKLHSVEWTDTKVLTYSIIEDVALKRDHLMSVNLVLTKI